MPIPVTPPPTWASDTNFSSGPESGTPTKVEPSAGAKAQGEVPGQPYRGQRHNWLWNAICTTLLEVYNYLQLTGTSELLYGNTRSYARRFHLGKGQFAVHALDDRWRSNIGTDGALQLVNDASIAAVSVSTWREPLPTLPVGASWTQLDVFCQPNTIGVVQAKVWKRSASTTTQIGSSTDTISTSVGALLTITFTETIDATNCYFLELLVNGADAGGPVTAEARYFILTWSSNRASGAF